MVEGHFKEFFMFQVDFVFFSVRFLIFFFENCWFSCRQLKENMIHKDLFLYKIAFEYSTENF